MGKFNDSRFSFRVLEMTFQHWNWNVQRASKIDRVVLKSDRTDSFKISHFKLNNPVQVTSPLTLCQIITEKEFKIYNYFNSYDQNGQTLGNKSMQNATKT